MRKSIIRIAAFLLILALVLGYANRVFKVKYGDGIYELTKFYELEDNSVDVLILGSSLAFENFNTGVLWDEFGMASFILGSSLQPMWNSYYFLKEALKTQTPELIVLEAYRTVEWEEYCANTIIKSNYGLKWSADKVMSIMASAPRDQWVSHLLGYTQYHYRYTNLGPEDFLKNQNNRLFDDWKGFGCNMGTQVIVAEDVTGITEMQNMSLKTESYYMKILELAREWDIPILVVAAPLPGIEGYVQRIYNKAAEIASDYGGSFLNCNLLLDEIGIDFSTDSADPSHLNYRGNQKFSSYIGQYIKEHYEISDRRGDERYASWQRSAEVARQMIEDQELVEAVELGDVSQNLSDENYWIFLSADGNCSGREKPAADFLRMLGIEAGDAERVWLKQGDTVTWRAAPENDGSREYFSHATHDFMLESVPQEDGCRNRIVMDCVDYRAVENGINVLVYDTLTERIVVCFGLDMEQSGRIVRDQTRNAVIY